MAVNGRIFSVNLFSEKTRLYASAFSLPSFHKILYRGTSGCCADSLKFNHRSNQRGHAALISRIQHQSAYVHGRSLNTHLPNDFIIRSPYPDLVIPENVSLSQLLMNEFPKYRDATALVDGITGKEMTYSQLHTAIIKVASSLIKMGTRPHDVIMVFSPNCPEYAVATIAIAATGAVFSAVNPVYTVGELMKALELTRSRFLITVPALLPVAREAVRMSTHVKEIIVFGEAENCRSFSSLMTGDGTDFPENLTFDPKNDICSLPFSSGTTGLPKAVKLSHYNLVANITQSREENCMGYKTGLDRLLAVLPFFHIYGQTMIMFTGLFCGAKIITLPNFEPSSFLQAIQSYQVTILHIVPPMFLFFIKHPLVRNYDISSIKTMFIGAAPMSVNVIDELMDLFNKQFVLRQGFGLTEASPCTNCNPPRGLKYHTCGPCLSNTEFKVIDTETQELLEPGKTGEICVRGPQVMLGYFENEIATKETLVDGWMRMGDLGHSDEDGHLIISDRIKELIKVKGLQVAPAELEAVLVSHPSVQDAAVIGLKHEQFGEVPKAFVVLKPQAQVTVEELHKYLDEKVAPYKRLTGGIEFHSEIPRSGSGKILRRLLKTELTSK